MEEMEEMDTRRGGNAAPDEVSFLMCNFLFVELRRGNHVMITIFRPEDDILRLSYTNLSVSRYFIDLFPPMMYLPALAWDTI
jgi:hypothetical protein